MVNKNKVFLFLRFFVSFGLIMLLLWIMRKDIGPIVGILKNSNKTFFMIGVLITLPLSVIISLRLKLLMLGQKINLPLKDIIYLTYIGYFFNNFFPTAIGGDIAKAYYAAKKTNNKAASFAAVLVDRLMGFLSTVSIAIIGIIFVGKHFKNNNIVMAMTGSLIALMIVLLVLFSKKNWVFRAVDTTKTNLLTKIKEKLFKVYTAINYYRRSPFILIKAYLLGVFCQACAVLSIYFFVLSLGGNIHMFKLFLIIPLVWAVSMLPSLNGLGVREGAFIYFLKGDIGPEIAFGISLLWLGVIILLGIIGGILHLAFPVKVMDKTEGVNYDR